MRQTTIAVSDGSKIITKQDNECAKRNLQLPRYDALLVFVQQDIDFATKILENLENQFNICVPQKDFMPGLIKSVGVHLHKVVGRCHCVIAIITPDFNASNLCRYLIEFCLSTPLPDCRKKIVMFLPKSCALPRILVPMTAVKYFPTIDYYGKLREFIITSRTKK